MQLLALNREGRLVSALQASKSLSYDCLECKGPVRLRGGMHRQLHFYHLEPTVTCRQHQKGMVHIQVQQHLLDLFGEGECQLEFRMSEINRIADVVWLPEKIVFEIQCSPITALEVSERNRDYQKMGWTVIWILNDRRFNQARHTAAEEFLRATPHYYTNIDGQGMGYIYDQFDHLCKGWRVHKLPSLPVTITEIKKTDITKVTSRMPTIVKQRLKEWPLHCSNDLIDMALCGEADDYLDKVHEKEQLIVAAAKQQRQSGSLFRRLLGLYQMVFHHFLEKATR